MAKFVLHAAHCTCIAGLGETCSHVGALLFSVEHKVFHLEERTVTGVKAYWKIPGGKAGEPSTSKNINYMSVEKLRQNAQGEGIGSCSHKKKIQPGVPEATQDEIIFALTHLWEKQQKSVLHRLVEPFASEIERPEILCNIFKTLYNENNLTS